MGSESIAHEAEGERARGSSSSTNQNAALIIDH